MHRVGLTGNIASGKSSVAGAWRELGATVVDADSLARQAVEPGTPGLDRIRERWGSGVILPSGELDRRALRDIVFRDPEERLVLEAIIHPEVHRLRGEAYLDAEREGLEVIVADIPLLFEAGLESDFDTIVLVDAPEHVRFRRLVEDRGLDPEEARRMIDAQWPSEQKRQVAHFLIDNAGSVGELRRRAKEVWEELKARALAAGGST